MGAEWVRFGEAGGDFCHLRGRFKAFSNDFEQFFAKVEEFRAIFNVFERKLSGFLQVRSIDYADYTD